MYTNCIYAKFDTITELLSRMFSDIKDVTNNDKATYGWHVIMSYIYKYIVCTKAKSNYMLLTHQIPIKL